MPDPLVAPIDEDGTVNLPSPPTIPHLRTMEPDRLVRWARLIAEPGDQRPVLLARYGQDVAGLSLTADYEEKATLDIIGIDQSDGKPSFDRVQRCLEAVCVMTAVVDGTSFCDEDIELDDLELPPPTIDATLNPFACSPAAPAGDPERGLCALGVCRRSHRRRRVLQPVSLTTAKVAGRLGSPRSDHKACQRRSHRRPGRDTRALSDPRGRAGRG